MVIRDHVGDVLGAQAQKLLAQGGGRCLRIVFVLQLGAGKLPRILTLVSWRILVQRERRAPRQTQRCGWPTLDPPMIIGRQHGGRPGVFYRQRHVVQQRQL